MALSFLNSSILFEGSDAEEKVDGVEEMEELKEVEETLDEYPEPDENTIDEIETEAVRDFASLEAASFIIDAAVMETALLQGESQATTLMENAVTDTLKKVKDFLISIAKKIKAFFLKLIQNLKVFFMNGKEFVKKYKNDLTNKTTKGFKKSYHKMDFSKIDAVDSWADKFKKKADDTKAWVDADKLKAPEADEKDFSDEAFEKEIKNETKVDSIGKVKEYLEKECGIYGEKTEISDFSQGASVAEMIKFIEGSDSIINATKNAEQESSVFYTQLIAKLGAAQKKAEGGEGEQGKLISRIKRYVTQSRKYASFVLTCRKAKIDVAGALQREAISVLKSFMYYNPKVEKNSADFGAQSNMFDAFSI